MDPDLLGGNSCVLFQLLEETPRGHGPLANKQHSKTVLERIENWSIPKPRVEVLACSLLKKNLDIEVLKKAQAMLVPAVGESLASNIVQSRAEADKWKMELLKGIVFKMMRDIEGLEETVQEMEALRRKAQEWGQKNMDIEAARREAAAEHESRLASSLAAMTEKANDDELRIELLQRQLAEKCNATEILELTVKAIASRAESSIKAMRRKAKDDELRIQLLQNQLAAEECKATEAPEIRRAIAHVLGKKELERACKLANNELDMAHKRVDEDPHLLMKEDLEDFPAAKRTKLKGGADDFTRVKVAGDEEVSTKQRSEENGRKNISTVNDSINHVKWGVGANSGEGEVNRRLDQIPQQRVRSPTPSAPSAEQDSKDTEYVVRPVPVPDFHDFDAVQTENDILPGQIWAVYDDQDGMPRFYAHISRVTTSPFRAHVTRLEHCPATEE